MSTRHLVDPEIAMMLEMPMATDPASSATARFLRSMISRQRLPGVSLSTSTKLKTNITMPSPA